ncbi:MAG TPA: hypothetical protein V6C89_17825 [Drouetiella sp.]|jgi:hypothetical protein
MSRHELHRGQAEQASAISDHYTRPLMANISPADFGGALRSENQRINSSGSAAKILRGNYSDFSLSGAEHNSHYSYQKPQYLATGDIAAKYESRNNPGMVNRDPNHRAGHDFGAWQFNSKAGVPQEYVKWAKNNDPEVYAALRGHTHSIHSGAAGSFGRAWREHAKANPDAFNESQRRFAMDHYLRPLQDRFPRLNQDQALQEQAFATAIQSGVGGATRLLRRAGFDRDDRSSQELIANLTAARTHAYRRNAGRYAAEGQEIEALNQNNHLKKFDRGAFSNLV